MPGPAEPLLEATADPDPFVQFGRWFDDAAVDASSPEAMAVATVAPGGGPSVRMVLLKSWDERGFVFFTNYTSRKGVDLDGEPRTALLFHWEHRGRQVRIEGSGAPTSDAESDAYFAGRPRGSQLSARVSWQSRPVADRGVLEEAVRVVAEEFAGREVPRPPWWGGIRVAPSRFEFWQHREDRLHDRLLYEPAGGGWRVTRLQP